jgi:hypothetical protein
MDNHNSPRKETIATGPYNIPYREPFVMPLRIDSATGELTFIEKVQALLARRFQKNKEPYIEMTKNHWLAHSTIRSLTKKYSAVLSDNMVKPLTDIIESSLLQLSEQVTRKEFHKIRIARDLATLTPEQIEESNHVLPPIIPRPLGSKQGNEYKIDVAQEFISKCTILIQDKIDVFFNQRDIKRSLFEKQLEKPQPYQGFDKIQYRRNPKTIKPRFMLKRETLSDPAQLFGVDSSTLPGRDNLRPHVF